MTELEENRLENAELLLTKYKKLLALIVELYEITGEIIEEEIK